jgi:4-alpha-glucanotransferase
MHPVSFIFCLHNHQPEGNFESVFREATAKSYRPFLELLARYPDVKVSLHYSGILLRWIEQNEPDLFETLRTLVRRGQVEMLGGGFYEPILPVIPDTDKHLQIRALSDYISRTLGVEAQGMWLAERIWEQHLVKPIARAGMRFTVLDDTHFLYAGLQPEELNGYYLTEEEGDAIAVFPISKALRYAIPFSPVAISMEHLYTIGKATPNAVVVYADDGEKFGVWPKTFESVWEKRWLEVFFTELTKNKDWLRTRHFAEVLADTPPVSTVYLPNASYAEMMHWSLPTAKAYREYEELATLMESNFTLSWYRPFFKGGFWRNFLVKYPEVNTMHKKMLRVSKRLRAAEEHARNETDGGGPRAAEARTKLETARDRLLAAQCNCPYWHGVFGGLYLPHIRHAVYANLLHAESLLNEIEARTSLLVEISDFDLDGREEVLVETPLFDAVFTPADGAKLIEWDYLPSHYNLLNTLTRREEGYHSRVASAVVRDDAAVDPEESKSIHEVVLAKEEGLDALIHYDWYRKGAFIEHLLGPDTTIDGFLNADFVELGDFANQPWSFETASDGETATVRFHRDGGLWRSDSRHSIRIEKHFFFSASSSECTVEYRLVNLEETPVDLWFAVEFNYNLLSGDAPDKYYSIDGVDLGSENTMGSKGEIPGAAWFGVTNEWDHVAARVDTNVPAMIWRGPLETVSLSEDGFERTHQGATLLLSWRISLVDSWDVTLRHALGSERI